ncbi:MAG: glycosyltransferase family 4 protein [candidate division KSB1 bacterium]|nr:glycosyltransferase family 4 protein [candidate division KSB1 bacterium]MDZ7345814.1 glycosyltransferase family 4 protein [candidate division KSB1 bacterium]
MKRLAINALLLDPQAGGIAVYIKNLIDGILQENAEDWMPKIIMRREIMRAYGYHGGSEFLPVRVPTKPVLRIFAEIILLHNLLQTNRIDLLHAPISYYLPNGGVPTIITVHDLRILHFPESYVPMRRYFLQRAIPWAAHHAFHIIAVSHFTKNNLMQRLNVPAEKVTVIHSGISFERFNITFCKGERERVRSRYGLPEKYFLAVGHLEPRKNYERLIEAFSILRRRGIPHHLVIVGRENWQVYSIYERVRKLGLSGTVHFTRFVAPTDLPIIYQSSQVFVAPSLFEGFGFTPLEAMAAGVPVAVSNAASHPEICQNAALYFDPFDPKDMADKLELLLDDNSLRQELINRGFENIRRFSWKTCISQTLRVYQKCLMSV